MKTTITTTERIKKEISSIDLRKICQKSIGMKNFNVIINKDRTFGHYITIETDKVKKYVLLSSKTNQSRNAYLAQFVFPAYSDFILDKTAKKKIFEVFLFANSTVDANYNIFIYRLLKTYDIKIINESDFLKTKLLKFFNYKEIEDFRNNNRDRNAHNQSTYFSEEKDHIEIFGKVFGANGEESAFISLVLQKLSKKPIWLYQIYDNKVKTLPKKALSALELLGVKIKELISEIHDPDIKLDVLEKDLRDTPKFHYNLLKKFNVKKCYLCSCDIGGMIIGSHIHRVADIKKDNKISIEKKIRQIIDGDNGFWLCADHDKLFELGLVFFKNNRLKVSNILSKDQIKFVSQITERLQIESIYFTKNTKNYIKLHFNRTQNYSI